MPLDFLISGEVVMVANPLLQHLPSLKAAINAASLECWGMENSCFAGAEKCPSYAFFYLDGLTEYRKAEAERRRRETGGIIGMAPLLAGRETLFALQQSISSSQFSPENPNKESCIFITRAKGRAPLAKIIHEPIAKLCVLGYLNAQFLANKRLVEIFDVCTIKAARGSPKRVMSTVFNVLLQAFLNEVDTFELGVNVYNPAWAPAVNTYTRAGFRHPELTNVYLSGMKTEETLVRLTLTRNDYLLSPSDLAQLRENVARLRETHLQEIEALRSYRCHFPIFIPGDLLAYLQREYVEHTALEVAGIFKIQAEQVLPLDSPLLPYLSSEAREGRKIFILAQYSGVAAGERHQAPALPISKFNFHTHPHICYRDLRCYVLWPSAPDMMFVLGMKPYGNLAHFVITAEGVYMLQLTPEFSRFYKAAGTECQNILQILVGAAFIHKETLREEEKIPENKKLLFFNRYLQTLNTLTNKTLIWELTPGDDPDNNVDDINMRIVHWRDRNNERLPPAYRINLTPQEIVARGAKCFPPSHLFKLYSLKFMAWKEIQRLGGFLAEVNTYDNEKHECLQRADIPAYYPGLKILGQPISAELYTGFAPL